MTYHIGYTGTRRGMTLAQRHKVEQLIYDSYASNSMPGEPIVAHHGDCVGGDKEFHDLVRGLATEMPDRSTRIVIHPAAMGPEWVTGPHPLRAYCQGDETREPKPPLVRNQDIVDAVSVERPDDAFNPKSLADRGVMIATPWEKWPQVPGGTWATIRMALRALRSGRLGTLWVVGQNGLFMDYKEW